MDRFHRHHAVVELAIRDLEQGAGFEHVPSGNFHAHLGGVRVGDELTVARTVRTRLVAMPGRLVNRAGRTILRLPTRSPWADTFTTALHALPSPCNAVPPLTPENRSVDRG